MSDRESFLRAITAAPNDMAPRLVFADWLDETGAPADAARAEFIRLEINRPAIPGILIPRPDADRLLREFERNWLPPCLVDLYSPGRSAHASPWTWRRGFVEHLYVSPADFFSRAAALRVETPLLEVDLTDCPGEYLDGPPGPNEAVYTGSDSPPEDGAIVFRLMVPFDSPEPGPALCTADQRFALAHAWLSRAWPAIRFRIADPSDTNNRWK
ncbi:MAG: TIGR02996 domain-containing protein [Zavarzinella sp.]|nr:TIGR02996 domain-containing protein [Zavarzinella sp.]